MGFVEAIKTCLKKYVDFSGRASRPEFWYFVLFLSICSTSIGIVEGASSGGLSLEIGLSIGFGSGASWLTNIFSSIFGLPMLAVMVRRLNDTGLPIGKYFAILFGLFAALSMYSKAVNDQMHIAFVLIPLFAIFVFFIYVLTHKSENRTNKHGPNPLEVTQ